MPTLLDQFPIFKRSEVDIRADYDLRANAGLTVNDPDYVDTRVGSPFYLATQVSVIHSARQVDRMNEIAVAAIPATSWGEHLDNHAASYGLERKPANPATGVVRFTGDEGTLLGTGIRVSPVQTDPEIEPPVFFTTTSGTIPVGGFIDLEIQAEEDGDAGNVAAGTITFPLTGVEGVASISNPVATNGGVEVESDEALVERMLQRFQGKGAGNQADYVGWGLENPEVGRVTVVPVWQGAGTVQVILMTASGDAVSGAAVAERQLAIDPVPQQGKGLAPISHAVTVTTPASVQISVVATVTFQPGYSLDGIGGTTGLRSALVTRLKEYIDGLEAGQDVIYNHVQAQFFREPGVLNVSGVTVNGGTADIAITTDPPQVAQYNSAVLT